MRYRIPVLLAALTLAVSVILWWSTDSRRHEQKLLTVQGTATPASNVQSVEAMVASRMDRPHATPAGSAATKASDPSWRRVQRLLRGDGLRGKISRDVIHAFLTERGRSAASLLVAWQESGNRELLDEAAARFPDDPRVQIAMLATELSGEERMEWVARFKASDPDNALANYYAAAEFLQGKNVESALAELAAGNAKPGYEDYMMEQIAERDALFRAAGLAESEARLEAMFGTPMPFLRVLNQLRQDLAPEIRARIASGDARGAMDLGRMGVTMAEHMRGASSSRVIINDLVAMAIERGVLESLGPPAASEFLGRPVADRLAELAQQRETIHELTRTIDPASTDMTADHVARYVQILVKDGEIAALQWLKDQKR